MPDRLRAVWLCPGETDNSERPPRADVDPVLGASLKPDIELVIPAHNESDRLAEAIAPQIDYFGDRVRFTIILDHCTDGTESIVQRIEARHPNVEHFIYGGEQGKGGAIHDGFSRSTAEIVGFMDADCPTPPVEIDRLIDALGTFDGAVASRYLPGSLIASPRTPLRTIASRLLNVAVRGLFGMEYRDTQCGAKVFRRSALAPALEEVATRNWLFDVDLLVAARSHGLRIAEVPVIWCERAGSHLDVIGFAPEAARSLLILRLKAWRSRRSRRPRRSPRSHAAPGGFRPDRSLQTTSYIS